jgi:integrase
MASVSERGGRWYLRYRDASGKWVRQVSTAETKTAARHLAAELERRAERQRLGLEQLRPKDGGGTLAELLQWWLDTYSKAGPSHARNTYSVSKHFICSVWRPASRRCDFRTGRGVPSNEEHLLGSADCKSPPPLSPDGV